MLRQSRQVVSRRILTTCSVREFSSTPATLAFKKKSSDGANSSVFKRGTPKKNQDVWIHDFINTATYGKFSRQAVTPQTDGPGSDFFSVDNLEAGKIFRYPTQSEDSLRIFGSYRRGQKHELFQNRTTLIRESSSLPMADAIANGRENPSQMNRICLMGNKGTGKSSLLAQTQSFALENGYVVIPIPRAGELISGENDAFYNEALKMYIQPMYVRRWMKRIAKGNKHTLSQIQAPAEKFSPGGSGGKKASTSSTSNKSLYDILLEGRKRADAVHVMEQVMSELASQEAFPVLFTMDDINVLAEKVYSANTNAENNHIYHGDLQVPKTFLDYLSGSKTFKKGAVVTALNSSHKINETILAGLGLQAPTPYSKLYRYDPQLASKFDGVKPLKLESYNHEETKALLEYWSSVKVIPETETIDERFVHQKYLISGNGNPEALLLSCTETF